MNLFSPKIFKRLKKKYELCGIKLDQRLKKIYLKYGPEINDFLDLDDFIYSCLSKYLEPIDVQSWFCSVLEKNDFISYYLSSLGIDPLQEKAINFMIEQINKNIILILQSTYDPVGAFDENGDAGLFSIFKSLDKFNTRHFSISSLNDIKKITDKITNHRISHLVVMAHGSSDGIALGKDNVTTKDETIYKFAGLLRPKLDFGATILLHSCSVGEGGGRAENFANTLSILLPTHKIYAAESPIARGDLLVNRFQVNSNGKIISKYQIDNQKVVKQHREPYRILEFMN